MSHWHSAAVIADQIEFGVVGNDPSDWGVHRDQYAKVYQAMSIDSVCANIFGSTRGISLIGGYEPIPEAVVIMAVEESAHAWIVAPVECKGECEYTS